MSKAHSLTTLLAAAIVVASPAVLAQSLSSSGVRAVPTYEAVGLYWSGPGAGSAGCDVRYRRQGDAGWSNGLALWFDAASNECRGSLVNLLPGTAYEAQLGVGGAMSRSIAFTTWSNAKPEATTIRVASGQGTYDVNQGGSASGYVVYDGTGSTLDAANAAPYNITINASYVIVRGFTLKGAQQHGILISPNVHDVVIEGNDISGWGRTRDGTWGTDMDSGIRAICSNQELERVTVQKNRIHDPRYSANSWTVGHPAGPQGITFSYCGGNHVFRWNEITSPGGNYFNDTMGGEDNFSTNGFPYADSDVYGNVLANSWDDGIEAEGANRNVRIWGNYIDSTATGIATTIVSVGPVYIFRNLWNRNRFYSGGSTDADDRQPFFKSGSSADFANGRRYLFHNTMLQAESGSQYPLGGGAGIGGTGNAQLVHNTVSMNNIYHLWKPNSAVYQVGTDNTFDHDMFNGRFDAAITSGINATPTYLPGHGAPNGSGGYYQLAAGTPGYDGGTYVPNFSDGYLGAAPDVGAAESGAPPMRFGLAAATSGGTVVVPPTSPTPAPTPAPAPSPAPSPGTGGTAGTSLGIDSSSYTIAAGQGVTFTVTLSGASGTPTGNVEFRVDGAAIAGCAPVAIASGQATCTTSALPSGSHAITGIYSGSSVYSIGQAGPITQTVTGTAASSPPPLSQPAAGGTSYNVQSLWWGSSAESGWGLNLTHQGDTIFATWFTYDASGKGQWLVMSNGARTGANTYAGTLYRTSGPAYDAATFDPSRVTVTPVGSAKLSFSDANNGTFSATVEGQSVTKAITREVFASPMPTCSQSATLSGTQNFQDLWWHPAGLESGWGLNVSQQGDVMFVTWFTYDTDGTPMWLVASRVARVQGNVFAGELYSTRGPVFNAARWDPAAVAVTPVGSVSLSFADEANGTFTYTVNGVTRSKPITRQQFGTPATVCR